VIFCIVTCVCFLESIAQSSLWNDWEYHPDGDTLEVLDHYFVGCHVAWPVGCRELKLAGGYPSHSFFFCCDINRSEMSKDSETSLRQPAVILTLIYPSHWKIRLLDGKTATEVSLQSDIRIGLSRLEDLYLSEIPPFFPCTTWVNSAGFVSWNTIQKTNSGKSQVTLIQQVSAEGITSSLKGVKGRIKGIAEYLSREEILELNSTNRSGTLVTSLVGGTLILFFRCLTNSIHLNPPSSSKSQTLRDGSSLLHFQTRSRSNHSLDSVIVLWRLDTSDKKISDLFCSGK
jgi:hypothetical protein